MNRWWVGGAVVALGIAASAGWFASRGPSPGAATTIQPVKGQPGRLAAAVRQPSPEEMFAGSQSCRDCHADFYEKWSTSHHGLAMQPFSRELAENELKPQIEPIQVGSNTYRADIVDGKNVVIEEGPDGTRAFPIEHVLGGKNVYYFLTPHRGGRLQVLPVAFDVQRDAWYDTAMSAVRHFPTLDADEPLHWTDREFTFNTSCYGCHVSQISTNYDPKTDTYHTTWTEPGINCETCHNSGLEHAYLMSQRGTDQPPPEDIRILKTGPFAPDQMNAMCGSCHAKMSPLTQAFVPGETFFDHYELVTLEDPDFYPDGRDLGENYTMTSWNMSPCVQKGGLDCMHCHTSSGRSRFTADTMNNACLPCHQERVDNAPAHTMHAAGTEGNNCVSCHMPMTEFARMKRSDHSMRPPMPSATLAFQSPNACNLCHTDKDAQWADDLVRQWRDRDYQAPTLALGKLIAAARQRDWSQAGAMFAYLQRPDRDAVFAASLIRLMWSCEDPRKQDALIKALDDPSPLVRSSAANALTDTRDPAAVAALFKVIRDPYRLVRIRAAAAMASLPAESLPPDAARDLAYATTEYLSLLKARPDDAASHFNLGNYHMGRGEMHEAVTEFNRSQELDPRGILPLVNASIVYNHLGSNDRAEKALRQALVLEPKNAAANLNLGLLLAEMGKLEEAQQVLAVALEADPRSATAAFNLGVMAAGKGEPEEAIRLCRQAQTLEPANPKYVFTLAYYLAAAGEAEEARGLLRTAIDRGAGSADVYAMLGRLHEERGEPKEAQAVYEQAQRDATLPDQMRQSFQMRAWSLTRQEAAAAAGP